jgi:ABC-type antimicrobial peptide transport system permease subunit
VINTWFIRGQFLDKNNFEAVVGDSTANNMYSADSNKKISISDPLLQGVKVLDESFRIVGVCVDPINNGFVVYVPIEKIANLTSFYTPNVLMLQLESSVNHSACIANLQEAVESINSDLTVVDLNNVVQRNVEYLGSRWAMVTLVPLLCLTASIFSLIAFLMMTINEQNQEFAVLRATGMKPKTVVTILGTQSLIVLLSSFFIGISIGTIITLLILMREPLITGFTILQISGWLLSALAVLLLASLYPALKFAKKPLTELMS